MDEMKKTARKDGNGSAAGQKKEWAGGSTPQFRKGITFALSALVLGGIMLAMASALAQQSALARNSATAIISIDSLADARIGAEKQLGSIIGENAEFNYSNSTLVVADKLPWAQNTQTDLARFANFTMGHSDTVGMINATGFGNGNFYIRPGYGTITHGNGSEFNITPDNVSDVTGYVVDITFPPGDFDSAAWQQINSSSGPSAMAVNGSIHDPNYATYWAFNAVVDKGSPSIIAIKNANVTIGYVSFGPQAGMGAGCSRNISLKTSVSFTHPTYVEANVSVTMNGNPGITGLARVG